MWLRSTSQTEVNAQEGMLAVSSMTQQNKRKGHVQMIRSPSLSPNRKLSEREGANKRTSSPEQPSARTESDRSQLCCGVQVVAVD